MVSLFSTVTTVSKFHICDGVYGHMRLFSSSLLTTGKTVYNVFNHYGDHGHMKIHTALNTLKKHGFDDASLKGELAPNALSGNILFWGKVVGTKNGQIVSQSVCFPPSALLETKDILRVNGWRLRHEDDKDVPQADYFAGISGLTLGKAIKMVG